MKRSLRTYFLIISTVLVSAVVSANTNLPTTSLNLMPYPTKVVVNEGHFQLPTKLNVSFSHVNKARMDLITQQLTSLAADGIQRTSDNHAANISIDVTQPTTNPLPSLDEDESYDLRVTAEQIQINANSERGALHAIQTLLQLVERPQARIPLVAITDQPRFVWRGLLIDSVRHFMPIDTIKRQIRGMASAKLNVLHWHLTDDQGWRIESNAYPQLQQLASDGLYYTRVQMRDVVAYAAVRGIRVVPEFDVPGHASAIAVAYPELITQPGDYKMQRHWGVFEPLLDPSNPQVYQFIETIIAELAELFPDPYLHIGGDEVNSKQWQQSTQVQAYMQANQLGDEHQLHTHFNQRLQKLLNQYGKHMMGWDEIFHPDLPKDILVQSWRGLDSLHEIANHGYQGLLSTGFYIDQPQQADYHYRNDPLAINDLDDFKAVDIKGWQQWQFTMPRLKGSAVQGELALFTTNDNANHGSIQLNKQQPRALKDLTFADNHAKFWLDSWMGPLTFELDLQNPQQIHGRIAVGNTPYPITGKRVSNDKTSKEFEVFLSQQQLSPKLTPAQFMAIEKNILGGEATIWSEMVTADNLDLRIWPRLYAIAERLWSPAVISNKKDMYRRLLHMQDYADEVVGLKHKQQQQAGFQQLTSTGTDTQPLIIFAEAIEQAQYYTRHHSKFQNDEYHQLADLKRFVDYLPAQSLALVNFINDIDELSEGNATALPHIEQRLTRWQKNIPSLDTLIKANSALANLEDVVRTVEAVTNLGLKIVESCKTAEHLTTEQQQQYRQRLWQAAKLQQEIVVSSALVLEKLLLHCQ
ncbi:family 20 glycosylhydrolase [Alteromonadaceae bacterium BrNp21-10]|nr:family 20 glycosylhydrolase [Alteromonadaceae bacterium BrNp21-10]